MTLQIGQSVHYYPAGSTVPHAAIVTSVNEDNTINVAHFSSNGDACSAQNVPFVNQPTGEEDFACCVAVPKDNKEDDKAEDFQTEPTDAST